MNDDGKRAMSDETGAPRGLGHVVYGDHNAEPAHPEREEDAKVITEASEESFPASDPPNYTVGNPNRSTSPDEAT
jgi:hypothetical protein